MSVELQDQRKVYTGNGTATTFPFPFTLEDGSQVAVTVADLDGTETVLTYGDDYTVTFDVDPSGITQSTGSVVLLSALPEGYRIALVSNIPEDQQRTFPNNTPYYQEQVEGGIDKNTRLIQQIREDVKRAVKVPVTSEKTGDQYMADVKADMEAAVAAAQGAAHDAGESRDDAAHILVQCQEIADSIVISVNSVLKAATMTIAVPVASGTTLSLPNDEHGDQIKYHVGGHNLLMYYNGAAMFPGEQYNEQGTQGDASGTVELLQELRAGDTLLVRVLGLDASALADGESITFDPDTGLSVDLDNLADYVEPAVREQVEEMVGEDLFVYQKTNTRAWSAGTDYSAGALVTGSDGNVYAAQTTSGPASTAVDPVGDESGTWAKLANQPDVDALTAHDRTAFFRNEGSFYCELENYDDIWYSGTYGSRTRNNGFQSMCYDKNDHVIYVLITRTVGSAEGTILAAFDADTKKCLGTNWDPSDTTTYGCVFGYMTHQGFGVYHPAAGAPVRFFAGASNYASKDDAGPDATKYNILNLVEWDYKNPSQFSVVHSWQITDGVTYHVDMIPSVSVSDDGTEIVCYVKDASNRYHFMVFDVETVLSKADDAVLQAYAKEIFFPVNYSDFSQGVFIDDRYFYCVGYNVFYPHIIQIWDRNGEDVTESSVVPALRQGRMLSIRPQTCECLHDFPDITRSEAEGFIFMPRRKGGKNHLMLEVMPMRASTQRSAMIYDFEVPARPAPNNVFYPDDSSNSNLPDLDKYITPGTYYFNYGGTHFPTGVSNGFLVVIRVGYVSADNGWSPIRQLFFRSGTDGSTGYNVFIRTANSKAANSSEEGYTSDYYFQTPTYTWSDWEMFITETQGVLKRSGLVAQSTGASDQIQMYNGTGANQGGGIWMYGKDNTSKGAVRIQGYYNSTNSYRQLNVNPSDTTVTTNCHFIPMSNNTFTLGEGSTPRRWKEVFANTGSINTSDERLKSNIAAIPDAVLDAWAEVNWQQFQFNDAIDEKGSAARLHSGLIAQRIDAVFKAHGLDAARYALFCHDAWDAREEEVDEKEGFIIQEGWDAGDLYSLRYEEALCMEAAYQRRRASRAEARLATLEQRMEEMEQVIAVLGFGGNSNE